MVSQEAQSSLLRQIQENQIMMEPSRGHTCSKDGAENDASTSQDLALVLAGLTTLIKGNFRTNEQLDSSFLFPFLIKSSHPKPSLCMQLIFFQHSSS